MKYEVLNLKTKRGHGTFDTLDEARGCVLYDRLTDWEIWAVGVQQVNRVVAYRDTGRF